MADVDIGNPDVLRAVVIEDDVTKLHVFARIPRNKTSPGYDAGRIIKLADDVAAYVAAHPSIDENMTTFSDDEGGQPPTPAHDVDDNPLADWDKNGGPAGAA